MLGWAISVMNLSITYIFLTYGVLRVTLFICTLLAVRTDLLTRFGLFLSVVAVSPVAIYLNMNNMKLEGAIVGFFLTPVLAIALSKFIKK